MTAPQLESVIASLAARIAGAGTPHDPAASFASLGLDSLGTVELSAELERITGLDVAPEAVAECKNARALARRLRRSSRGRTQLQFDSVAQMIADAALPADVRPSYARGLATLRPQAGLRHANTVLLTGATGFLGRWIARELLETSPARLLCIVRASRTEDASSRLANSLARAGCSADAIRARVRFVEANLEHPRLGLDPDRFEAIAEEVDAVCHAGASVNWVHSYSALRDVNVVGTLDLLRLACLRSAPFFFISSASVCYSTAAPREVDEHYAPLGQGLSNASEREARAYLHGLHLGYAQTKAVAESLVREAGRRGLPVTIYRSALISGHSADDDFNGEDLLTLLVRGCVRMGDAPDLDWTLDALPVDAAARWIADLSASAGTFHLRHARPRHWRECVLWMRVYGYPVRLIPYAQWIHQLERELDRAPEDAVIKHPLYPLRRFFIERPHGADGWTRPQLYEDVRRTRLSNTTTMGTLARTGSECVELDGALLEHYFEAFQLHASLPSPPDRRSGQRDSDDAARRPPSRFDASFFTRILDRRVVHAVPLSRGSEHSIVSELTAWRARRPVGLFT
jgi:thioester reductase-like protein